MKKLFALAVLGMFLFLLGGRIVLYEALTVQNRIEMMHELQNQSVSSSALVSFNINANAASEFIDGDEISWQGHRYDIVSKQLNGNILTIHAINDKEEEKLMGCMNEVFNASDKPLQHRNTLSLLDDFFKEYTSGKNINIDPQWVLKHTYNHSPELTVPDGFKNLVIPPPKIKAA